MNRTCLVILVLIVVGFFFVPTTYAAEFSALTVRMDYQQPNQPLSGLVCATPSNGATGTEASVSITFPSDFNLTTTPSDYTTSTSEIPADATAWPSIGSAASAISGQTVTFSSSNLPATTKYCFQFTASGSTTGGLGERAGTVTTRNASNTLIDQADYGLAIMQNNTVIVGSAVPAQAGDIEVNLDQLTSGDTFGHSNVIEYEITYGSLLPYAATLTVEAQWSRGTVEGSGIASVDVLQYDFNTASRGYNNTAPIVDLENRQIRWIIPNFPANRRNEKVTFRVVTTKTYTQPRNVSFTIAGRVYNIDTQTPDSTETKTYRYGYVAPITPTVTPIPTATPTPPLLQFESFGIEQITDDRAQFTVQTSAPSALTVSYGLSPSSMTTIITSLQHKTRHRIVLDGLKPNTQYYMQLLTTTRDGQRLQSDIFTFTTATQSDTPTIDARSLLVISNDTILLSSQQNARRTVVINGDYPYKFRFSLENNREAKTILVTARNSNVLGATSADATPLNIFAADAYEVAPSTYESTLIAPTIKGLYDIFARITDVDGNIIEEKLFTVKVSPPLTVVAAKQKTPIERAEITLLRKNSVTRLYEILPHELFRFNFPLKTNRFGTVALPLPHGTYRAEITAVGYAKKTFDFTLSDNPRDEFPTIELSPIPYSLLVSVDYYFTTAMDSLLATREYLTRLIISNNFFSFMAFFVTATLVLMTLFATLIRWHLSVFSLPHFLAWMKKRLSAKEHSPRNIYGTVRLHETQDPIPHANVYAFHQRGKQIIAYTKTDTKGQFCLTNIEPNNYKLVVLKNGYEPDLLYLTLDQTTSRKTISIELTKHHLSSLQESAAWFFRQALAFSFELLLIASLLFELLLGYAISWHLAAPYIGISAANLILWLLHVYHHKEDIAIFHE